MPTLPEELLRDYANNFYGYGSWDAKTWFVGIEEAGGKDFHEIDHRLEMWEKRGRRDLEDACEFYPECRESRWHGVKAIPQRTWKQLI